MFQAWDNLYKNDAPNSVSLFCRLFLWFRNCSYTDVNKPFFCVRLLFVFGSVVNIGLRRRKKTAFTPRIAFLWHFYSRVYFFFGFFTDSGFEDLDSAFLDCSSKLRTASTMCSKKNNPDILTTVLGSGEIFVKLECVLTFFELAEYSLEAISLRLLWKSS